MSDPLPRLFVLGAGFSAPAGLPVATELLKMVRTSLHDVGLGNHLDKALDDYQEQVVATTGRREDPIDLERFAAYLDYEHHLRMLGGDHWDEFGNRSQCELRWGIGRVLHKRTPSPDALPQQHLDFAAALRPRDTVLTFNYDLVLEAALDHVGRSFRRFPDRFANIGPYMSTIDQEAEDSEVLLAKLHGSIDWISTASFQAHQAHYEEVGDAPTAAFSRRRDPLFGESPVAPIRPLLEAPQPDDAELRDVHVVLDLDAYFDNPLVAYSYPPVVLPPSEAKQLYGAPLRGLWADLSGRFSYRYSGMTIIGYSLPPADPYALQAMYRTARSYTHGLTDSGYRVGHMRPIEIVDKRESPQALADLHQRYRFLPEAHSKFDLGGFTAQAVQRMFDPGGWAYRTTWGHGA